MTVLKELFLSKALADSFQQYERRILNKEWTESPKEASKVSRETNTILIVYANVQVRQLLGWEEEENEEENRPLLTEEALASIPLNNDSAHLDRSPTTLSGPHHST